MTRKAANHVDRHVGENDLEGIVRQLNTWNTGPMAEMVRDAMIADESDA
jgi:hypothetical protein